MDLDVTLIVQAVILLLVLATLGPILLNPILEVLELREKSIEGAKHDSKKLLEDTLHKERDLEAKLEGARRQALQERAKLINEAKDQERQLLDKAKASAQTQLESARTTLKESEKKARAALDQNGRELAKSIAGKILSRDVA
jgi:F-type H+-transporting ATPase subunit b